MAGGFNGSTTLASAELYNPATSTWSPAGTMAVARNDFTATLLPNGNVLVAGGAKGQKILSSAELYNPATNKWSPAGHMATPRTGHTATLLRTGKVLVAGGFDGLQQLASAELYNPATNTWSPTESMATPRSGHTATRLVSGKVLVAGGTDGLGALSSAELYNPKSNTWSPAGTMMQEREFHTATLLQSGGVLVSGGVDSSFNALASAEVYLPDLGVPALTGLSPTQAAVGTSVTITGRHLGEAMVVRFDGVAATFKVVSDTRVTATVPRGALTGPISVMAPALTLWSATNFKVTPTVKSFIPTKGPVGTKVTITGDAFTGATKVLFHGTSATFTVKSYTEITAKVPKGATTGPIAVVTPGGKGASKISFIVT